jgi:hypothetical protein
MTTRSHKVDDAAIEDAKMKDTTMEDADTDVANPANAEPQNAETIVAETKYIETGEKETDEQDANIKVEDDSDGNPGRPYLARKAKANAQVAITRRRITAEEMDSDQERLSKKRVRRRASTDSTSDDSVMDWQPSFKDDSLSARIERSLTKHGIIPESAVSFRKEGSSDSSDASCTEPDMREPNRQVRSGARLGKRGPSTCGQPSDGESSVEETGPEIRVEKSKQGKPPKETKGSSSRRPKQARPTTYVCEITDCNSCITHEKMTAQTYAAHMITEHSSKLVCNTDACENRTFTTLRQYKWHRTRVHTEKTFPCQQTDAHGLDCKAAFSSERGLTEHYAFVHGEKTCFCDVKGCYLYELQRPLTEVQYQDHQRWHTRSKKRPREMLTCGYPDCDKVLPTEAGLRQHEWIVHGLNGRPGAARADHLLASIDEKNEDEDAWTDKDTVEDKLEDDDFRNEASRCVILLPSWDDVFGASEQSESTSESTSDGLFQLFKEALDEEAHGTDSSTRERNIQMIRLYPHFRIGVSPLNGLCCIGLMSTFY